MAPKRKAAAASDGRPSKRTASGVNTPVSLLSDDDYSEEDSWEEMSDRPAPRKYDSE